MVVGIQFHHFIKIMKMAITRREAQPDNVALTAAYNTGTLAIPCKNNVNMAKLDEPLVRVSTMAERDPPMRPDQLRNRSGRPLAPAPALGLTRVPSPSPSSITCTFTQTLAWFCYCGLRKADQPRVCGCLVSMCQQLHAGIGRPASGNLSGQGIDKANL